MTYFHDLMRDRSTLTTSNPEPTATLLRRHKDFGETQDGYVDFITEMSEEAAQTRLTSPSESLRTDIGKALLNALAHNLGSLRGAGLDCCIESEPKLIKTLNAISNSKYRSPVIVTHQKEPVGIIKQHGLSTLYGLEDAPEIGIYRGMFHHTSARLQHSGTPGAEHAWKLDADKPYEKARLSLGGAIRPSLFLMPERVRKDIPNEDAMHRMPLHFATEYSHDDVVSIAADSLKRAKTLFVDY